MFKVQNKLAFAGILVAVAVFGTASPARANILLNLTDTTTSATTGNLTSSGTSISYSGSVGDFSVTIAEGQTNSPGGPYDAITQQATVFIKNNGSTAETLSIVVSANYFSSPTAPPALTLYDVVNGTTASGPANNPTSVSVTGTAQGFANTSNVLGDTGGLGAIAGTALSFQASGLSTNFSPTSGGTMSGNVTVDSLPAPYSLTFVETFTLSAGGSLTVTDGNVQVVVPEPATLMMAFSAVPVLGLGAWLRRRQVRPVTAA
jgi:hypothetical protein